MKSLNTQSAFFQDDPLMYLKCVFGEKHRRRISLFKDSTEMKIRPNRSIIEYSPFSEYCTKAKASPGKLIPMWDTEGVLKAFRDDVPQIISVNNVVRVEDRLFLKAPYNRVYEIGYYPSKEAQKKHFKRISRNWRESTSRQIKKGRKLRKLCRKDLTCPWKPLLPETDIEEYWRKHFGESTQNRS